MNRFSVLFVFACLSFARCAVAERPNIVLIMADDLGLGDLGCYGGKAIPTPNIDRLAAEGLLFTNAYSASAVCAPTRCGLMTGKHMGHATRRANGSKNGLIALAEEEVTIAELLREQGYATGGFGKWGLGNPGTSGVPEKQGFDLFFGYYDQQHAHNYFPAFLIRNSQEIPLPGGNGISGKPGKGEAYSQDWIADATLKFLESHRDQPFFCYAAWTLPHGNFEIEDFSKFASRDWSEPVKKHAAMIARLDADVGRLLDQLKSLGLDQKTVVIFTSDNGAEGPGRTTFDGNAGLRGFKRHLYEGGIRTPLLVRWPGTLPSGTNDRLWGHIDFLSTFQELAGGPAVSSDGISMAPTLRNQAQGMHHSDLYWEIYEGPFPFQQAVRVGPWKGYRTATEGPLELYDLVEDPIEAQNIASSHPATVKMIESLMAHHHQRNPNWDPTIDPKDAVSKKKKKNPPKP